MRTQTITTRTPGTARRATGFTLMEVLIAIAILGIGLVAVAAIFPAAIMLQKQTMDQVEATNFSRNAKAEVAARGFELSSSEQKNLENDGASNPNPDTVQKMPASAMDKWSLFDRAYSAFRKGNAQRVFWIPLIYDADTRKDQYDWRVFLFVVRARGNAKYTGNGSNVANPGSDPDGTVANQPAVPRVRKDTSVSNPWNPPDDGVVVDDKVLGSNGVVYKVTPDSDNDGNPYVDFPGTAPDAIWYADSADAADDKNSTFVRLITLIDSDQTNVVRKP